MVVIGIGCRRHCPAEEIALLVADALAQAKLTKVDAVATIEAKATEAGIIALAHQLGVPLRTYSLAALQSVETTTVSPRVLELTGVGSVAEAAALAAAGSGATLLLPRIASERATCAIASSS